MKEGGTLPLTTLALAVDLCWAIEPQWGLRAKRILDEIDMVRHCAETREEGRGEREAGFPIQNPKSKIQHPDEDETDARPGYTVREGVATLLLTGPLTKRPQSWGGGTATVLARRALRQAANDPQVRAILLLIDSPGGQVAGAGDLAADVALVSAKKPVAAYCEDMCCSAAYWIASQAGAGLYANPTATVGSIGTLMVLEDTSRRQEQAGIAVHVIATGDRKGIGTPGTPLTEGHLSYLRDYLEQVNAQFMDAVQRARRLSPARWEEVARAGIYVGADAVRVGLIDAIKTRDEVLVYLTPPAPLSEAERGELVYLTPQVRGETGLYTHRGTELRGAIPYLPGHEEREMKEKLVKALTLLGLRKMAVAVVGANDDSAESLASAMSEQVQAEVEERVAAHPLVLACTAAGLGTPQDLQKRLDLAAVGERYVANLRDEARAQAIRAFGAEMGARIAAGVHALAYREVEALRDAWSAHADATYGIGKDGSAAERASAPKPLMEAVSASGNTLQTASRWDQLNADQRAMGLKMGMNTPEKQEQYATEVLNIRQ